MTVHGVAIIRTFTTSLHTPFTSVPEPGAISQPFARGTKQPYSYNGSDDSDSLVFLKRRDYSTVETTCLQKKSTMWPFEEFKGLLPLFASTQT